MIRRARCQSSRPVVCNPPEEESQLRVHVDQDVTINNETGEEPTHTEVDHTIQITDHSTQQTPVPKINVESGGPTF